MDFNCVMMLSIKSSSTLQSQFLRFQWMPLSNLFRSSHRRCFVKRVVYRNFAKFTGKHLCQRFFFNKVAGLSPATLLKKSLWHRCFPVNFEKFLRTPFFSAFGRLLLFFRYQAFKVFGRIFSEWFANIVSISVMQTDDF